jgi:hypothetical protein
MNEINLLNEMIIASKKEIEKKIISQENKYKELTEKNIQQNIPINPNFIINQDVVMNRDRAVISDPLYPPLGRTERPIFDSIVNRYNSNLFNYPTRGSVDTFRLLGYLVNSENKKDKWKLFGRQKYPGSSIGEYYVIPINHNTDEMKITLKDSMMPKDKLRDIYALPSSIIINSPIFDSTEYNIIELDKTDFTSPYL